MIELKPCPFCGETPNMSKHFREDIWQLTHRCPAVGAITFDWTTSDSIAKGWNTRDDRGYLQLSPTDMGNNEDDGMEERIRK